MCTRGQGVRRGARRAGARTRTRGRERGSTWLLLSRPASIFKSTCIVFVMTSFAKQDQYCICFVVVLVATCVQMGDNLFKLGFIELMYTDGLQLIQLYVPIFAYYMFQLL